jgi:hypothetical protein
MLTAGTGGLPRQLAICRIIQVTAASLAFSGIIAIIWSGNHFFKTALASFVLFHGGFSPIALGITPPVRNFLRKYLLEYAVNLVILLIATVLYKYVYGSLLLLSYDWFAGIILYLVMGGARVVALGSCCQRAE